MNNDTVQCDDCGLTISVTEQSEWSQLNVKPKGIHVVLNLCGGCTRKRDPKPKVVPVPKLGDCLTPYQVTGFLLWCSGYLIDVHLPTKRSAVVTVKVCDAWHVMDIYEDTISGKAQLYSVIEYLKESEWGHVWDISSEMSSPAARVAHCSNWIYNKYRELYN